MTGITDGFVFLCSYSELKEGRGYRFFVNDKDIAVFKVEGEIYALSNVCPHQHAAIIYDGFIEEGSVVCPAHGWSFDLATGKLGGVRRGLENYEVKKNGDEIYIRVPPPDKGLFG